MGKLMGIKLKKSFQIVSTAEVGLVFLVLATFLGILPNSVLAYEPRIQFYRIDVDVDENQKAAVNLIITFKHPEKHFSLDIIGRIEGFEANSNAGPIQCDVKVSGTSSIECDMNLTEKYKQIDLHFETNDFVKSLDNKFYLSADLTPNKAIDLLSAAFKLPNGFLLVGENMSSSLLSYSENATAHLAGGRILIVWSLSSIELEDQLKFEILYEQVKEPLWFQLRIRHFILFGAAFAVIFGFVLVRYIRRSEKLVLSVLDEHERRIMEIITKEGEIKQKKIVNLTNLSKAKVSRVVKSLSERGLIEVERVGRTNRIKLSKKGFEL